MKIKEEGELEGQHAADPVDRAGAEVEANDREALRAHRAAVAASGALPEPTGTGLCVEEACGEPVEPARLALGLGRCLACAEEHERRRLRAKRGY
jgi:RNA polymerase-binding transcription factor DksA